MGVSASLTELFESIEGSADRDRVLLEVILAGARERDPELAEVIASCAIPRRFDAEIIGVLRGEPGDDAGSRHLLDQLRQFNFVQPREDRTYAYHDDIRDLILGQWRKDAGRREEFERLSGRLIAFYKEQHDRHGELMHDLYRVAEVVRRASPARARQLAAIVESRLLTPLLEALYHGCLLSPEGGYELFWFYYQEYEGKGNLFVCRSLIDAMHFYLDRLYLPEEAEPTRRWLRYWEARHSQKLRRYDQAERLLGDLLKETGSDVKLRLWAMAERGDALNNLFRLEEARDVYQEELCLAKESRVDPYNLPTSWLRIGNMHMTLGKSEKAEEEFRRALEESRAQGNEGKELSALLGLCGALQMMGHWSRARDAALEALEFARTRLASDSQAQSMVAWQFMSLTRGRDPRLLDSVAAEHRAMVEVEVEDNPFTAAIATLQYLDHLRLGSQLTRADALLKELEAQPGPDEDPVLTSGHLLEKGLLLEDFGHLKEATRAYDKILELREDAPGIAFNRLAALSNRGQLHAISDSPEKGSEDLQHAVTRWEEMGNDAMANYVRLFLAKAYLKNGQRAQYRRKIAGIRGTLRAYGVAPLANYHRLRGEAALDLAHWEQAQRHFRRALRLFRAADQWKDAAEVLGELCRIASSEGRWQDAANAADNAARLWHRLARRDAYRPTKAVEQADRLNAAGMRHLVALPQPSAEEVFRAREAFREANQLDPKNAWYLLNLAYVHARLQEWKDAAEAIQSALGLQRAWLPRAFLDRLLAQYRFEQGEGLFKKGRYPASAQIFNQSLNEFGDRMPPERAAEYWLRGGDCHLKMGRLPEAKGHYERGLALGEGENSGFVAARLHCRLGLLTSFWDDLGGSIAALRAGLESLARSGGTSRLGELVAGCGDLLSSGEHHANFAAALRLLAASPGLDEAQRRHLREARLGLSQSCYRRLPAYDRASLDLPPVEASYIDPIRVAMSTALIPDDRPQMDAFLRILKAGMAARRKAIAASMGVTVPPVRFIDDPRLAPGAYALALREVPWRSPRPSSATASAPMPLPAASGASAGSPPSRRKAVGRESGWPSPTGGVSRRPVCLSGRPWSISRRIWSDCSAITSIAWSASRSSAGCSSLGPKTAGGNGAASWTGCSPASTPGVGCTG